MSSGRPDRGWVGIDGAYSLLANGGMSPWRLIQSDFRRSIALGGRPVRTVLFGQGLWATAVYRVSHSLYQARLGPLRKPVRLTCQLARKGMEVVTGISLPPECTIGPGLYIGHFGTIIVSPQAVIGSNCNLSQGVTLGVSGRAERRGAPTLGNRVYVAANAVVAGQISIGDDAVIGAGAVVTSSVPPRAVVVGNPGQIKSFRGSFEQIVYEGMESDVARLASRAQTILQRSDQVPESPARFAEDSR